MKIIIFVMLFALSLNSYAVKPKIIELKDYPCKVDKEAKKKYGHLKGHAGCIIIEKGKLLVTHDIANKNKIGIPGGTAGKDESSMCTAGRETYEETGVHVKVHELLHNFHDRFYVFRCELQDKKMADLKSLPVPEQFQHEISKAYWLNVDNSKRDRWRFPNQFLLVRGIVQYYNSKK